MAASAESEAWQRTILECLTGPGGEVSARIRTVALAQTYASLDRDARRRFLSLLAERFGPDGAAVDDAIRAYQSAQDVSTRIAAGAALRDVLKPPRRRLLTQFNAVERGVKFLVDLRADLLSIASQSPYLAALDDDLKRLLVTWLDFGFLELKRITWGSPAALLEKLIAYEAVHAIRSWEDLRNRLDSDRRCYALFHPSMPDEPLAFVEVALCSGMATSVQKLLDEAAPLDDPRRSDTAVFYSISSCQRGLQGISFGEFLIKRAVEALSHDLPRIETYATLSPIPGFRVWLEARLARDPDVVRPPSGSAPLEPSLPRSLLADKGWVADRQAQDGLQGPLTRLCARYFADRHADGQPIDPVARFHLRNGARLDQIHWLADTSSKGLRQSLGLMASYRYAQGEIDANHEAYAKEREIAVSPPIHDLMKESGAKLERVRAAPGH